MRTLPTLALLGLLVLATGCATNKGPDTVEATGTVTLNGEPVEGALVVFSPQGSAASQLAVQAKTDVDGAFALQTYLGGQDFKSGIQPGDYRVSITKLEVVQDMRRQPKHLLPKKYRQPNTSGLNVTVTQDGDNVFPFDLE